MTQEILTVSSKVIAPDTAVVSADGELDHSSRETLAKATSAALESDHIRLVLDLAGVIFCDSGGLSLFVDLHRTTLARGGWLRLAGARGPVRRVLEATNLDRILALYETPTAAIADGS